MLTDSMNVGVIAENIKKLEAMVQEAGSELPTPEAGDVGKILKVGSDGYELAEEYSYTPPAYSSTDEVNTGRKWIDGKNIYCKSFSGNTPSESELLLDVGIVETLIKIHFVYSGTSGHYFGSEYDFRTSYYDINDGKFHLIASTISSIQNTPYVLILEYTKPTPVPSNETKKKTSKKGE